MSLFNAIGGLLKPVQSLKDSIFGNTENSRVRDHTETMASKEQYAAEFVARAQRTWFDSAVDGVNRLIRPAFAIGIMYLISLPFHDQPMFIDAMEALAVVPQGMWVLVGTVIAFYFGGRLQIKGHDFKIKKEALAQAQQNAVAMSEKEFQTEMENTSKPLSNKAIMEWNKRQKSS